jgi:hypothetical protein
MSDDKYKEENPDQSNIKQEAEKVPNENSTSIEPTLPEAQITVPSSEPDTIGVESENETMEVHHHPHIHHNKKWKDYLFEFAMVFLAITAGFFTENQREHYIESKRENQYIKSFIEDLKTDTSSLSESITTIQRNKTMIDSLMYLLNNPGGLSGNDLYYYARFVTKVNFFKSNDRTITQLKNSGGLRLIRNQQASDSIMSYEQLLENLETNKEIEQRETAFLYPYLSKLFDPNVFESMVDNYGIINRPVNNPSLRNVNQEQIKEFMFYLHQKKTSYLFTIDFLNALHAKAVNLIRFLQQEYQVN